MICATCPSETIQAKDGLCKGCRLRAFTRRRQKYVWTPAHDAALRRAYRSKNKVGLNQALTEIVRRTSWPRYILQNRAQALGLRMWTCERWEPAELEALRELAGTIPSYKIAKRMGRSQHSVCNKIFQLGLESRVVEGFSVNELCPLFGVHHLKVEIWMGRGWLLLDDDDRVTYASVARFVWDHMEEYRFAACDEWWLKTMLKPQIGTGSYSKFTSSRAGKLLREERAA
jgi:hypothetical protein